MFWILVGILSFICLGLLMKAYKDGHWNVRVLKEVYRDIRDFYHRKIAWNTGVKFSQVLWAKVVIVLSLFGILFGVQYANLAVYKDSILNDPVYKTDLQYEIQVEDSQLQAVYEEQMFYFEQAREEIPKEEVMNRALSDVSFSIESIVVASDRENILDKETLANAVYYRLYDLYKYQNYDILQFLALAVLANFLTEIFVLVRKFYVRKMEEKRVEFLKQLVIIEGSVPPIDFNRMLEVLIENSTGDMNRYLKEVKDAKKSNTTGTEDVFRRIIEREKRGEYISFFEKLDQADNYDFGQAVRNIDNEFRKNRTEKDRKNAEKAEQIRSIGLSGFLIILTYSVGYLIYPWIGLLNFDSLMGM